MNAFSRSWLITKLTFSVINKDRELLGFALLSFFFSTVFTVAMIFPFILTAFREESFSTESIQVFEYVLLFIMYLGLAFIATFFNVCVVYTTKVRFEGGNATFEESIQFAFSRIRLILLWSLLSASVGLLLRILQNFASRLGKIGEIVARIIIGVLGLSWSIVSIFVVPVLVYEGLGPIDALKKSAAVIRKTWGESLIRSIGLGLVQFLAFIGIIVVAGGITYLLTVAFHVPGLLVGIGIGLMALFLTGLIFSIANKVFNTALYVYANNNQVASGFDTDTVKNAFQIR
jgi:hypothetical protein